MDQLNHLRPFACFNKQLKDLEAERAPKVREDEPITKSSDRERAFGRGRRYLMSLRDERLAVIECFFRLTHSEDT